jgi:CheY-like chemotaxis protein
LLTISCPSTRCSTPSSSPPGFATAFATDGEKGLARYKAEKFDLVLADIDMKPMDGITLLKQLKIYDPAPSSSS